MLLGQNSELSRYDKLTLYTIQFGEIGFSYRNYPNILKLRVKVYI